MKVLFNVVLIVGLLGAAAAHADEAKWACKKDGKDLAADGKTDADKKAACEKAGGKWTKVEAGKVKTLGNGVGNG